MANFIILKMEVNKNLHEALRALLKEILEAIKLGIVVEGIHDWSHNIILISRSTESILFSWAILDWSIAWRPAVAVRLYAWTCRSYCSSLCPILFLPLNSLLSPRLFFCYFLYRLFVRFFKNMSFLDRLVWLIHHALMIKLYFYLFWRYFWCILLLFFGYSKEVVYF